MNAKERLAMARNNAVEVKPITSALAAWDGQYTDWAIARVLEVMEKDFKFDRKDGSGRLRPSSLSKPCDRAKLLSFHGEQNAEFSRELQAIASSGTFGHYRWQLAGLSAGIFTDIEVPFSYDPWRTAGSADARMADGRPFELKTMTWQKFKLSAERRSIDGEHVPILLDEHLPQLYALMAAFGTREVAVIYEERNTLRYHEFLYHWDDAEGEVMERSMAQLVKHVEMDTMPPILHGCMKQRGNVYTGCGFKEACFREG